jgi:carbonic anhydrase
MSAFDEFIQRNQKFASSGPPVGLTAMPANRVFVVTCIDPRVEPAGFLGVSLGDAIVLRNPGGRITETAIADIALISYIGEAMGIEGPPMEVAVIHHTQCGMGFLADDAFRHGFAVRTGLAEAALADAAVVDPEATVRVDVQRLLSSRLASDRIVVSGHVLNLDSGVVTTVLPACAPERAGAPALESFV